jgi:DNA polymerase IV (DinB-like DNA polymerase)
VKNTNIIAHIDMNAFFASVEERDKSYLMGSPIAVGADPKGGEGRGVVATANYLARAYGLHAGLPITRAWRLSQQAKKEGKKEVIFITPTFRKYGAVSKKVFAIIASYAPLFEATSIDEGYADLSFCGTFERAETLCRTIQEAILKNEKLTCSIGIGVNKMVAKIASDIKKPLGLVVVPSEDTVSFLQPLPIKVLPGVGEKTEQILKKLHITKVSDVASISNELLTKHLGVYGKRLVKYTEGIDERVVEREKERAKSIGEEETFDRDITTLKEAEVFMERTAKTLFGKLEKAGFKGAKKVTLIARFSDFETKTRGLTLTTPIATSRGLSLTALKLLLPFFDKRENAHKKGLRLLGLRLEKLL